VHPRSLKLASFGRPVAGVQFTTAGRRMKTCKNDDLLGLASLKIIGSSDAKVGVMTVDASVPKRYGYANESTLQ
jgi:hypothetical protein